jgi:putative hydrolase of the HAD superfamily
LSGRSPAPRAVLLDAMGTLLRLEAPAPALRLGLRDEHGIEVGAEAAEHAARSEMAFYRAHHDEGRDPESLARLRLRCAEVLRDALGPVARGVAPQALLPTLMRALRFAAFPDAAPALDAMRRSGARLAVVSNWDASLPEVLRRTGLAGRVDAVLASAVVGAAKPSPAIFTAALDALGVPASAALHVGDTVRDDVLGARAAGIAAVLLRRDPAARPGVEDLPAGVRVIGSLAEVAGLAP